MPMEPERQPEEPDTAFFAAPIIKDYLRFWKPVLDELMRGANLSYREALDILLLDRFSRTVKIYSELVDAHNRSAEHAKRVYDIQRPYMELAMKHMKEEHGEDTWRTTDDPSGGEG